MADALSRMIDLGRTKDALKEMKRLHMQGQAMAPRQLGAMIECHGFRGSTSAIKRAYSDDDWCKALIYKLRHQQDGEPSSLPIGQRVYKL